MSTISYLFLSIFTFIFSSVALLSLLNKFDSEKNLSMQEKALISFGVAPAMLTLILYYLLILLPQQPHFFYVFFILFFFLLIFSFYYKRSFLVLKFKFSYGALVIAMLVLIWQVIVFTKPLARHDAIEYGVKGNLIYRDTKIEYKKYDYDEKTGFFYVGKHGLSYSLFLTWQKMYGLKTDYLFRSVSGYYWILIVAFLLYVLKNINSLVKWSFVFLFVITPAFGSAFIYYHLDTYRIYLLMIAFFLFYKCITNSNLYFLTLLGICMGLSGNIHTLNMIMNFLILLCYSVVLKDRFGKKITRLLYLTLLILTFGGIHYLLDMLFGSGWIFVDVVLL